MADTIRDCIESVARQAGDVEALQHVVVDGGSDDGTLDVIAEYPHIELIHEPSPGIYVAMNCGIAAARHEVIGIVNADDLLKTGALGAVSKTLDDNHPVQIFAVIEVLERRHAGSPKRNTVAANRGRRSPRGEIFF